MLLVACCLAVAAFIPASRLQFDQSIESLYSTDDPHLAAFRFSRRLFGGDEFVIVAYGVSDLFESRETEEGIEVTATLKPEADRKLREFAEELGRVEGVQAESTQHLADALSFRFGRKQVLKMVEGVLVGADHQTVAVVLRLAPATGSEATVRRAKTFAEIRRRAAAHSPPAVVVGEPIQVHDMFRYVEEDGRILFWWSLGLLAAVILVLFRRIRWVLLPLLVVVTAILWTEAILVVSGMQLSMVSSLLNSLLTIIGVATVTHVTVHYRELRKERERSAALRQTLIELGPPVFWTGTTTAVGFAALLSSQITPVRSFGIMMAIGTAMVLIAAAVILPGGILLGTGTSDPRQAPGEGTLVRGLAALTRAIWRRPVGVILATIAVVVVSGFGLTRLNVETDFSENFRKESPIRRGLEFVESRLGGAGNWEVNFPAPRSLTPEYIEKVEGLAERLRTEVVVNAGTDDGRNRLTKVVAISDGLSLVPKRILLLPVSLPRRLGFLESFQSEYVSSLYNRDGRRMRIVLRAFEQQQAAQKRVLIEQVETIVGEVFPVSDSSVEPARATGLFVLLTFLIESLLRDQLVSFVLAAVGIAGMMTLAFRSLKIGLLAVVPNLFPIVLVIGAMGWAGLPINIATAMIASVSLGLTVDSSIHYISGFRRARAAGCQIDEALARTHQGVGRAVVLANLALVIGFSVLTLSHFIPLVYFGLLVSVAMLGGLVGNLVLLPVLLRWAHRGDAAADGLATSP